MASLEEVSDRLMKPAKELAEWNFPWSTVLDQYNTLVKEQDKVNLGNAALVVQNVANVYDRRTEYFFQAYSSLNESFAEHEAKETAAIESKKGGKEKMTLIDFRDFEPIDFKTFIGKNINMKDSKRNVKLLTQRFPQLENSRSSLPIEIHDIHGEVVGKKYDFRCNEYLTASGMLVEHLTPEDFLDPSTLQNASIPTMSPDSGTDMGASLEPTQTVLMESESGFSGSVLCQEKCEDSRVVQETETGLLDTSFASSYDSGVGSSIQSSKVRPDSSLSNFADSQWDLPQSRPGSSLSTADVREDASPLDNSVNDTTCLQKNVQSTEENIGEASQVENSPLHNGTNEEREETGDCATNKEAHSVSESTEKVAATQNVADTQKVADVPISPRRSGRLVNVIDAVNDLNPKPWEPIPFDGVSDKLPNRAEFKLPCPISLLKCKEKPRKRKITPEMQKKRNLKRLSTLEGGASPRKMTMYSPTRQLFHPFKKEELEDFQMCFEECFKNRSNLDTLHYEAVTDTSMDLLGYRGRDKKSDRETIAPIERGFPASIPKSDPVINDIVTNATIPTENIESTEDTVDEFPMPDTPESSDSASEISPSTPPPTYRSRIEQSVRDIYRSADVRTAEEDAVFKWHEYMEPRLREAERRPPFDVKQYSARVIERIKAKNDGKIEFEEMVNNEEPTEVARYFLASLQLASKYNLHIDTNYNVEGNLTLALFDKDR